MLAVPLAPARVHARRGPLHVLFIGNSYTRLNDLPRIVQRIALSVPGAAPFHVSSIANPGWDLARHWRVSATRLAIAGGGFTHVVLQGHSLSAIRAREDFQTAARLFDAEIDRAGARTVLLETWARRAGSSLYRTAHIATGPAQMQEQITECYADLARELGADLAPAGRAFLFAQQSIERPGLFRPDGSHPSLYGTYLAGLVIYAVVTHEDPRLVRWRPYPMGRRLAAQFRDVAFRAVQSAE